MKKLPDAEVKEFMKNFNGMTFDDVKQIADLFFELKKAGDYRLQNTNLDTVADYVEEYCNSWYRYDSFEKLLESEKEQGEAYGLTEEECKEEVGKSIFELKSGWFIQCVY